MLYAGLLLLFLDKNYSLQDKITRFLICRTLTTIFGQVISTTTTGLQEILYAGLRTLFLDKRSALEDKTTRNVTCWTIVTIFGQEIFTTRQNYRICYMPKHDYYFWTRDLHYRFLLQVYYMPDFGLLVLFQNRRSALQEREVVNILCRTITSILGQGFALQEKNTRVVTCRTYTTI